MSPLVIPSVLPSSEPTVCVIGAGPVGLFVSLLLAQAGIAVEVIEAEAGINQSPRAVAHHPNVVREFRKAGVLDDIVAAASVNHDGMAWRAPKGKLLGLVGLSGDFMVLLGQPVLAEIILRRLKEFPNAKILFGCRYVGCEQGDGTVTVHLEEGAEKVPVSRKCRILVGADGGHSPVRKSLGIPLEGFTWEDFRFVAANVRYAPLDQSDWGTANLVVHPTDWSVVVKTDKGDVWRVATGEKWDEALGEVENQKKLTERYRRILPGELDAIEFLSVAAYKTHQRCALRFLDGNVVLAGDSAHLNNPIGGLGLTTGLLDAAHLGAALRQILVDGKPYSVLQDYADQRREVFLSKTNPSSTLQKKMLMSTEPEDVQEREKFFALLNGPDHEEFERKLAEEQMAMATTPS